MSVMCGASGVFAIDFMSVCVKWSVFLECIQQKGVCIHEAHLVRTATLVMFGDML